MTIVLFLTSTGLFIIKITKHLHISVKVFCLFQELEMVCKCKKKNIKTVTMRILTNTYGLWGSVLKHDSS